MCCYLVVWLFQVRLVRQGVAEAAGYAMHILGMQVIMDAYTYT